MLQLQILRFIVKFLIVFLLTVSVVFAHKDCCDSKKEEKKWSSDLSTSVTNTSSNYKPTNHHKGLAVDHSHLSLYGPVGSYIDARTSLALHTSRNIDTKKTSLDSEADEISLKTTDRVHDAFGTKIGRFSSYISPANNQSCCAAYFVKRPILYRAFLGGHLIDNGAHMGYTVKSSENRQTYFGVEAFEGKGLMSKANRSVGVLALMARHQTPIHKDHALNLSLSYLLNKLYNQSPKQTNNHVGCCQASSFSGKNMVMGNVALVSALKENIEHNLSFELARVSTLANRFGRNNHHIACNIGSVVAVKDLSFGTLEFGARFDYLRAMEFCSCEGPYLIKTVEKTAMIGLKPSHHQSIRFEYTNQALKNASKEQNNIFQVRYTVSFSVF